MEAYDLIKDLEPTNPQEYIIKAVVNAALGQEQQSVSYLHLFNKNCLVIRCCCSAYPPVTGQRQTLSIGRSAHFSLQ